MYGKGVHIATEISAPFAGALAWNQLNPTMTKRVVFWRLKACPKCHGDMYGPVPLTKYIQCFTCLQCGREKPCNGQV